MRILFLMGSADISGGSLVIFEHALFALDKGHTVTIATQERFDPVRHNWHRAARRLSFVTMAEAQATAHDVIVATWWRTIADLARFRTGTAVYFVQSIESRFYPEWAAKLRAAVDATYDVPLPCITEARWIKTWLEDKHGRAVALVPNGVDKAVFTESGSALAPRQSGKLRVLVEGKLGVPFKNVARTIELVRRSKADEIWLLTPTPLNRYPGVDRVVSRVPIEATAAVYRSCDVIVKLSYVEGMFGPPLEMFHCGGTALTYDVTGADEYLRDDLNAIVVARDDEAAVIAAIDRLRDDPACLHRLVGEARATAATWPDWPQSSARFLAELERLAATARQTSLAPVHAAIGNLPHPDAIVASPGMVQRLIGRARRSLLGVLQVSQRANDAMALVWAARAASRPLRHEARKLSDR